MAKEITVRCKLVASRADYMGYITHVFENLEADDITNKYVMCVQFPNWEQPHISVGDIGFATVRYVTAGVDTWFNGTTYIPYKSTDIHFIKFVPLPELPEDVTLVL